MKRYYLADQSKIQIDDSKPIGKGGEGSVFRLDKNPDILVKIYTDRALQRMPDIEEKIRAMTEKKPGLLSYNGLTIIAWPSHVVYNAKGRFQGYVMRRVTAKNQLSHVITPGLQKTKFPGITFYDRVVIAINLAKVMDFIHKNDTVIGDINTSDFFVYEGFEIGVVDTDSFQFQSKNRIYPCKVFTPDYTPPEVIRAQKSGGVVMRLPDHDNYGLAILIFQILMYGVHPFSARIRHTLGFDGNAINYNMEHEIFPYVTENPNIVPPKNAMPYSFLPKEIQDMFAASFRPKKEALDRPSASDWVDALKTMKEGLKKCRKDKSHQYPAHFSKCPICSREHAKDHDALSTYFPSISRTYVTYQTDKKPVTVDINTVVEETIFGRVHDIRRSRKQAVFFDEAMRKKYGLSKRIDALVEEKTLKGLSGVVPVPKARIRHEGETVGYVTARHPKRYRLMTFLRYNRLGRMRITEETRLVAARNTVRLFEKLSKAGIPIEATQLFIDRNLDVTVPDIVCFPVRDQSIPALTFQKDDYVPYEHYAHQDYVQWLDKEEKRKEREAREAALEAARKESARQAEATLMKSVPSEKSLSELLEEETFVFETSHAKKRKSKANKATKDDNRPPVEVPPFDPESKSAMRFRLAVILHIILHDAHPFKGHENGVDLPPKHFIAKNMFLNRKTQKSVEPDRRMRVLELHRAGYRRMMTKALVVSKPEEIRRPGFHAWSRMLSRMHERMTVCRKNPDHVHDRRLSECPYCQIESNPDKDVQRTFIQTHTRRLTDHLALANILFDQLVVLALLVVVWVTVEQRGEDIMGLIGQVRETLQVERIAGTMSDLFHRAMDFITDMIGRWAS